MVIAEKSNSGITLNGDGFEAESSSVYAQNMNTAGTTYYYMYTALL